MGAGRPQVYDTIEGLNRALRQLPQTALVELRNASVDIAATVADDARGRAVALGGVARYVAPTIKASRDRVPKVRMGGARKLPKTGSWGTRKRLGNRQTVGDVIWGAEFGGGARPETRQFGGYQGFIHNAKINNRQAGVGRFLYPAVRANHKETMERYLRALDDAMELVFTGPFVQGRKG